MQALATQLASQLAAWHNRNPLARRVRAADVHTVGIVALPFMRSGGPQEQVEPALSSLEDSPVPVPEAATEEVVKPSLVTRLRGLQPRLTALVSSMLRRRSSAQGVERWPVFSEPFIAGLSPRAVGRFASHGAYSQRPDDGTWPQRVIPVDEVLASRPAPSGAGAWPEELYLLTAAVDAGTARTRVLMAQGAGQSWHVLGRRSLDPRRLAVLGVVLLALAGTALALRMHGDGASGTTPAAAASAASAASGVSATGTVVPLAGASAPTSAASAATLPASGASAIPVDEAAASAASATAASLPASASQMPSAMASAASGPGLSAGELPERQGAAQDIRPQLVPGRAPRANTSAPASEPASTASAANAGIKSAEPVAQPEPTRPTPSRTRDTRGKPNQAKPASAPAESLELPSNIVRSPELETNGPLVALVGPPMASQAEAEAYLQRMVPIVLPLAGRRGLEQQVLRTPDGWRAAIWPFASREEAQLINAMLVARGLRARAVDF